MDFRYFKQQGGALASRITEIHAERRAAADVLVQFARENGLLTKIRGATPESYTFFRDLNSSQFVESAWRAVNSKKAGLGYVPRRNTPLGKAMCSKVRGLPSIPSFNEALALMNGLIYDFPCMVEDDSWYRPTISMFEMKSQMVVVRVPWDNTVSQERIDEYRAEKAGGVAEAWTAAMDYLLWTPPADVIEIKEWEFAKMREEGVNASE